MALNHTKLTLNNSLEIINKNVINGPPTETKRKMGKAKANKNINKRKHSRGRGKPSGSKLIWKEVSSSSEGSEVVFTADWLQSEMESSSIDPEDLEGIRNPNGWLVLKDNSQYLSAAHSMTCKRYPYASRGNQGVACCVMAVAESAVEEVYHWSSVTLNTVLDSGNLLYQDSFLQYRPRNTPILSMEQILRKFYTPGNCVCRVTVYRARQEGAVTDNLEEFTHQLKQFFREETKGVFVAHSGEFAVALFRTPRGFYMFDPGDCDRYARAVPAFLAGRGRACLAMFPNVQLLAVKLKNNIPLVPKKPCPEEIVEEYKKQNPGPASKKEKREHERKYKKEEEDKEKKIMRNKSLESVSKSSDKTKSSDKVKSSDELDMEKEIEERESLERARSLEKRKSLEKKSSQVSFGKALIEEFKSKPPPLTQEGKYAIYGMQVTDLRKLNQYER